MLDADPGDPDEEAQGAEDVIMGRRDRGAQMIERELRVARPLFSVRDSRWAMRGAFINYASDLSFAARMRGNDERASTAARHLTHIQDDLVNVGTLMVRLAMTTEQQRAGHLPQGHWFAFTTLDIDHFHIQLRSALDHVAEVIVAASTDPRSMPGEDGHRSFRALQDWLSKKASNAKFIGEDLAPLIDGAVWFPELRELRDANVHHGARTLSFDDGTSGVLFQVYTGSFLYGRVEHMGVMRGNNIVDFSRYGALLFARLVNLLEALASALGTRLPCDHLGIGDAVYLGPWEAFVRWADTIIDPDGSLHPGPWADISPAGIITMRLDQEGPTQTVG